MRGAQIEARITLEEVKREGERSSAQANQMKVGEISKVLGEIVIVMEEITMDGDTGTDSSKSSNLCK